MVKSLRSTGSSQASRAAWRSSTVPPNHGWSVSTDRHAALPAAYALATSAGSRSGARSPFDGERRLISATTATCPDAGRSAPAKSRTAGAASACVRRRSRTCGRCSIVTASRLVARISSSTVIGADSTASRPAHSPLPRSRQATCDDVAMERGTVVVVDDEPNIADLVDLYLARDGFRVLKAATGQGGLDAVQAHRPRLVVLDVGLPDIDGLEVCRRLRQTSQVPVIFLTARDGELDRVLGLELGGDDYMTKPFSPAELVARVKAVLRRSDDAAGTGRREVIQVGDVAVDCSRREVRVNDRAVAFTAKEFDLLQFLAERPGRALSRQQILDGVWGYDWYGDPRTVDVHIARVRKKVAKSFNIATVAGLGYRLDTRT